MHKAKKTSASDEAKRLMQIVLQAHGPTVRPFVLPPRTPKDRVQILRKGFIDTMNDPESLFHLRNVSAEPLMPGAVPLNGVPEGTFNKTAVCGIRTIEAEAPLPDQPEFIRRFVMFQGTSFMVTG